MEAAELRDGIVEGYRDLIEGPGCRVQREPAQYDEGSQTPRGQRLEVMGWIGLSRRAIRDLEQIERYSEERWGKGRPRIIWEIWKTRWPV